MMKPVATALLSLMCATIARAEPSDEWVLTDSENATRIYQYKSRPMRLKAVSVVDARIENFAEVLRDTQSFPQWMDMCRSASLVSKTDENNMTIHILMRFPLGICRDLVVKADTVYDLTTARGFITLSGVKGSPVPSPPGTVRMPEFTGAFVFEYLGRERTGVVYTYEADPSIALPAAVVTLANKSILYHTIKRLGETAKRAKYVQSGLHSKDRAMFEELLSNEERVRAAVKARLSEHFRDTEMIDRLVEDRKVVDLLVNSDGRLAEKLFLFSKSRADVEAVARTLLRVHAQKYSSDKAVVERVAGSRELVTTLIDGSTGRPSSVDLLDKIAAREE